MGSKGKRESWEWSPKGAESVWEEDSAKENEKQPWGARERETKKILCHKAMEKEVLRRKGLNQQFEIHQKRQSKLRYELTNKEMTTVTKLLLSSWESDGYHVWISVVCQTYYWEHVSIFKLLHISNLPIKSIGLDRFLICRLASQAGTKI